MERRQPYGVLDQMQIQQQQNTHGMPLHYMDSPNSYHQPGRNGGGGKGGEMHMRQQDNSSSVEVAGGNYPDNDRGNVAFYCANFGQLPKQRPTEKASPGAAEEGCWPDHWRV